MAKPVTFEPGTEIRLSDIDTAPDDSKYDKKSSRQIVKDNAKITAELAYRLYAENRQAVLLVLQGIDTAGKDGTIRNVMRGVNPQSCQVVSFKQPSSEELDHDFLWRIHKAVPRKGNIGIFNRSHYEDVLVVRVHNLVPESEWRSRFQKINDFERMLTDGHTTLVKCFLHISHEEQRDRLQKRLDDPDRRWKFSKGDLAERKLWTDYIRAYEEALWRCNTEQAPWHIVPADRKWYRNIVVSELLRKTLEQLNPQFPPCEDGLDGIVVE